jgi:nicotinamide mononucleotide transporter
MNKIEWLAAITTILSVLLLAKGKSSGWLTGVIGGVLYGWIFIEEKLYANFILQIVFIVQGLYGMLKWNKEIPKDIKFTSKKLDYTSLILYTSLTLSLCIVLKFFTNSIIQNDNAFLDISLSIFSILALIMMAKRYFQSWFLWMMIDIGYIYLFVSTNMWISAILYIILFVICIDGYIEWRKKEFKVEKTQSLKL